MVKRLFLLSLMVLALCGASTVIALAGGAPAGAGLYAATSGLPPMCGPAATNYSSGEGGDRPCSRAAAQGESGCSLPGRCCLAAYSACLLRQSPDLSQPHRARSL